MLKILFYSFLIELIFTLKKIELDLKLNPYKFPYLTQNYFLLPITINNISYSLQIDTSLSTTWIPHTKYNYDILKSPIYYYPYPNNINKNKIYSIEDENGSIEGILIENKNQNNENKVILNENEFYLNYLIAYKFDEDYWDYFNGKIGLGFKYKNSEYNIINILKFNNFIDEKIFSLDFNKKKLIFGEEKKYNFSCNVISTEDLDDNYRDGWVCEMKYFNIEEDYKKINIDNFFYTKNNVRFDSAHDYITIPYKYKGLLNEILKKKLNLHCWDNKKEIEKIEDLEFENKTNFTDYLKFNRDDDYYDFYCDLKYINPNATLSFIIDENLIRIPLFNLFYEVNKTVMKSSINFIDEDDGIFIFGWNFFQNFKTFFDFEDKKVGFEIENNFFLKNVENEVKKLDEFYKKKEEYENKKKKMIFIIVIIIFIIILFIAIIFGLYCLIKKRTMNQNGPLIELENDDRII